VDKVYFILGCTAVGKGAVGREIARRVGGQIVSADSMKIYRRMDIGTAKPSAKVRAEIPHRCIDVVEPAESFSVARYVECADKAVGDIRRSGAVPLVVGGTGLYIKALSEGLFEGPGRDARLRERLNTRADAEGTPALHAELARVDPRAAARIHHNDRRRIIRALEVYELTGRPITDLQAQWDAGKMRYDCVFVGLRREKGDLHRRINARAKRMVEAGLREEVASLLAEPASLCEQAAQAVGYAEMISHLRGECSLSDALERIKINTRRLAKKQRTWWRQYSRVEWFDVSPGDPPEKTADEINERTHFA